MNSKCRFSLIQILNKKPQENDMYYICSMFFQKNTSKPD